MTTPQTEKQKMLSGEIYNLSTPELLSEYHRGCKLVKQYNSLDSDQYKELNEVLEQLLGKKGKGVWIGQPFYCHFGYNIEIGNGVQINMNCTFLDHNKITIGDNTGIGPGTQIFTVYHPMDYRQRLFTSEELSQFKESESKNENNENDQNEIQFWKSQSLPVTIGNNVWIGGGCIILPGVTIGDNSVIGSGSVVTKSIPAPIATISRHIAFIRRA